MEKKSVGQRLPYPGFASTEFYQISDIRSYKIFFLFLSISSTRSFVPQLFRNFINHLGIERLDSLEPKTQSLPLIRGSHPRNSTKCARAHTKFSTFYFLFPRISLPYSPKSNKRSFIDQNNQSTSSQTRVTLLNKIAGIEKLSLRSEKSEKKPI